MLYIFPDNIHAVAQRDYDKPYDDAVAVKQGEIVVPVTDGSMTTDFVGWTWCRGPDGRAGWVPDSWCEPCPVGWRLRRDFTALEFSARKGERFRLILSESGFVLVEDKHGDRAWLPDAVLALKT